MKDLSPSSYVDFAERLQADSALASDYKKRMSRLVSPYDCDTDCMEALYCDSMYFDPYLNSECKGKPIFDWTGANFWKSFH